MLLGLCKNPASKCKRVLLCIFVFQTICIHYVIVEIPNDCLLVCSLCLCASGVVEIGAAEFKAAGMNLMTTF